MNIKNKDLATIYRLIDGRISEQSAQKISTALSHTYYNRSLELIAVLKECLELYPLMDTNKRYAVLRICIQGVTGAVLLGGKEGYAVLTQLCLKYNTEQNLQDFGKQYISSLLTILQMLKFDRWSDFKWLPFEAIFPVMRLDQQIIHATIDTEREICETVLRRYLELDADDSRIFLLKHLDFCDGQPMIKNFINNLLRAVV